MPTVSIPELHQLMTEIFVGAGAPQDIANKVAAVLADNQRAGHDSHGIIRVPQYIEAIQSGDLDPNARPAIVWETQTTALVTGSRGFGALAANFATDVLAGKALGHGVAAVSLVETGHTGRLAAFTERAARRGIVMFMTVGTGTEPRTAPYGGREPVLGTNPIAFSLPTAEGDPVTLDFATSAIAAGKVRVASAKNEELSPGMIVDSDGRPTTNPDDFLRGGFLLPFGEHKGYALAVIAELMSGPLSGADAFARPGEKQTGSFMFAIRADAFRPLPEYEQAVATATEKIREVPPADGFDSVLVPGDPEAAARRKRDQDGVDIPARTWTAVCAIGDALGIAMPAR